MCTVKYNFSKKVSWSLLNHLAKKNSKMLTASILGDIRKLDSAILKIIMFRILNRNFNYENSNNKPCCISFDGFELSRVHCMNVM